MSACPSCGSLLVRDVVPDVEAMSADPMWRAWKKGPLHCPDWCPR